MVEASSSSFAGGVGERPGGDSCLLLCVLWQAFALGDQRLGAAQGLPAALDVEDLAESEAAFDGAGRRSMFLFSRHDSSADRNGFCPL